MGRHVSRALLLLWFLSLLVKFDASDAFSFREHRKLANSDGKGGENPTQESPVPNQQNLDPNKKKEEPPPPTNNDNNNKTTEEKGIEGSINSNNSSSPAPSPTPTLKDSNSPPKKDNKTASHSVTDDDGSKNNPKDGDGKDNGKGGDGKDNGKDGDGKDNGKDGNGKDNGKDGDDKDNGKNGDVKDNEKEGGKDGGEEKKGNEGKIDPQSTTTSETCDNLKHCNDNGEMVGCIFKLDPMYVVVFLQNGGKDSIKVKLNESDLKDIEVGTQETRQVNISLTASERTQLIFNAGHGDCVLPMGAVISNRDSIVRLPSYEKVLTPINGAYFLMLTVLVFGGTWACCKFRKKRNNEVPYQELEMAMPESAAVTNMESAEGWDQVWDDDWDDNVAVKPPGHARSISANGLTSRSSNKDGWEDNWDD